MMNCGGTDMVFWKQLIERAIIDARYEAITQMEADLLFADARSDLGEIDFHRMYAEICRELHLQDLKGAIIERHYSSLSAERRRVRAGG